MNINAIATTAARLGMALAGDATELVTLNLAHATGATYDPATDTMTGGAGLTVANVKALPFRRKNLQFGANLQAAQTRDGGGTTETLLLEHADLVAKGAPAEVVITEEDTVQRPTGEWQIVAVEKPPGGAIWLLDIRQ